MDTYTDEQCAQLMACKDKHERHIYRTMPENAMLYIIDLFTLVGDNPLIAHWLAHQYGQRCVEHVERSMGIFERARKHEVPQDMPSDYIEDFMHFVPSADPEYRESIILEMREGYALFS